MRGLFSNTRRRESAKLGHKLCPDEGGTDNGDNGEEEQEGSDERTPMLGPSSSRPAEWAGSAIPSATALRPLTSSRVRPMQDGSGGGGGFPVSFSPAHSTPFQQQRATRFDIEEEEGFGGGGKRRSNNVDVGLLNFLRLRFSRLYALLALIIFLVAAVLVLTLTLFLTLGRVADDMLAEKQGREQKPASSHVAMDSESEKFMRFYEELVRHGTDHFLQSEAAGKYLTKEQMQRAMELGIIPTTSPVSLGGNITLESLFSFHHDKAKEGGGREEHWARYWHSPSEQQSCQVKCRRADIAVPPLLVISLDGFSRQYLDRGLNPSLELFGECGTRAEWMYPSYPSKTFPNHYSMATGLYTESHGIVDNFVYDPSISPHLEDMRTTNHSAYFKGEPIWSAAVRQHRRAHCLFWPGCSRSHPPWSSYPPTVDIPYNDSLPFSTRVDMIVEWLSRPANERPALVMAYFNQPDGVSHYHTNDAQLNVELLYLETLLDYLFTSLHAQGLFDCTNILIVSDHGMRQLTNRLYLDELLGGSDSTKGMLISNGPVARIYFDNATSTSSFKSDRTEEVLKKLQCLHPEQFRVYDRHSIPKRLHYARGGLVGDVVMDARNGTAIYANRDGDGHVTWDHGYDYLDKEMRAIFFARGPNVQPGRVVHPFANVELFNLMVDLMRLSHDVANNGTVGVLDEIVHNMELVGRNEEREHGRGKSGPIQECIPLINTNQPPELKPCAEKKEDSQPSCAAGSINPISADVLETSAKCRPQPNSVSVGLFYPALARWQPTPPITLEGTDEGVFAAAVERNQCLINFCGMTLLTSQHHVSEEGSATKPGLGFTSLMIHEILTDSDVAASSTAKAVTNGPSSFGESIQNSTAWEPHCETTFYFNSRYNSACHQVGEENETTLGEHEGEMTWASLSFSEVTIFGDLPAIKLNDSSIQAPASTTIPHSHWRPLLNRWDRLQFPAYKRFVDGPLSYLRQAVDNYARFYKRLAIYSGTVHDHDSDGLADGGTPTAGEEGNSSTTTAPSATSPTHPPSVSSPHMPTHFFAVLMRCEDGLWHVNGAACRNATATRLLAFILPNLPEGDPNCLMRDDYLLANTARIRDIELLTGIELFAERMWFSERDALAWRTNITAALWANT